VKNYLLLALALTLVGCGSNSDGSSKSTYSSCKITQSNAVLASHRENDLKQCWNASGKGYESQGDALQWCERTVSNYLSNQYVVGHSVTYAVESTYCPK
jgi:uncharacterized lipoprotein YmbA